MQLNLDAEELQLRRQVLTVAKEIALAQRPRYGQAWRTLNGLHGSLPPQDRVRTGC